MLLVKLHAASGILGLLLILAFFLSTVASELSGDAEPNVSVKSWIVDMIPLLVLLPAGSGAGGNYLGRGRREAEIGWKRLRMLAAAINGVFILIPCALALKGWAVAGEFGGRFSALQAIKLVAGAWNIALLGYNLRDGLRLRRRGR